MDTARVPVEGPSLRRDSGRGCKLYHRFSSRNLPRFGPSTTLLAGDSPAGRVLTADRMRWQIERTFNRLKSLLHIDQLPVYADLGARSWLYPHLTLRYYAKI
jgi:hypothetical protein